MSVNLPIDINQLKRLVVQCSVNDKVELIRFLEKETFPIRFNRVLKKMKSNDLTFDEVTSEVEFVRSQRYNANKTD